MNKKEKVALVPRLRFPEFKSAKEWAEKSLGDITCPVSQRNSEGKKYPIYSINNKEGFLPQSDQFKGIDSNSRGYDTTLYKIVGRNTFAYNPARINVGSIAYSGELFDIIISSLYVCFKTKEEIEDNFLQYFLATSTFRRQVENHTEGGIRNYLFYENFSKILFQFPQKTEQQKIADCLSSLDDLIAAEDKKLESLKVHKKGLMQKLFPAEGKTVPEWRFPEFRWGGEWELNQICKKVDLLSGYPFKGKEILQDTTGIPLMRGMNITEGIIRHNRDIDRFWSGKIIGFEKYQLKKYDLVIGMDGSKVGKNSALITTNDEGALLIQRVARLRANSKSTILFIFHHINSSKFYSYVDKINTSSGIPHISVKQISDFEICFPVNEKEQQKIVDCLSTLDTLITAQAEKVVYLKRHKKGLMQEIFPSVKEVCE